MARIASTPAGPACLVVDFRVSSTGRSAGTLRLASIWITRSRGQACQGRELSNWQKHFRLAVRVRVAALGRRYAGRLFAGEPHGGLGLGRMYLDRQGSCYGQHLQQKRQACAELGRALPAQHGDRIGVDRGGQADLAAIWLAQT